MFFQFSSTDTRTPPNSTSRTAASLQVVPKSLPMTGCIQKVVLQYFTCSLSPPCCAATVAFPRRDCCRHQYHSLLLHRLVVTLVVCTRRPLFTCRLFSRKSWATTPSCALSVQNNRHGCMTHDPLGVTRSLCSQQSRVRLVMSQANG